MITFRRLIRNFDERRQKKGRFDTSCKSKNAVNSSNGGKQAWSKILGQAIFNYMWYFYIESIRDSIYKGNEVLEEARHFLKIQGKQ
ncbi:hypothetical protein HZS_7424 [Henneguya salminicola]|nr:hypothetical protein HZS_7424 [Henneguya salminicola]